MQAKDLKTPPNPDFDASVPEEGVEAESTASDTKIDRYISKEVQRFMRDTIEEYGGTEVFFVGRLNEHTVVVEAEALAFGNDSAVPVIDQSVAPGNVIIHNHPGGNLMPSDADLAIASRLGGMSVGTYIINNAASDIRLVVRAIPPKEKQALSLEELEKILRKDGPLSKSMTQYEERPQQMEMLRTVANAFNGNGIAVIEAGTGTGKSLAYLLPAVYWAKKNGEKVVISTNTINLQEQLIHKDIPFLQKHLGLEFKAELMKGRGNYLCKRRARFLGTARDFFAEEGEAAELTAILEWAKNTQEGSLSELGFIPGADAWDQVASDGDNCPNIKCGDYATCFFFQARRRASAADVIVANHHLVMADLAVRRETDNYTSSAVLPAYKRIILDEAHNIEDAATSYFGISITRKTLSRVLNRLIHRRQSHVGLLPFLRDKLIYYGYNNPMKSQVEMIGLIENKLMPLRAEIAHALRSLMEECAAAVCSHERRPLQPGVELTMRITPEVEEQPFWQRILNGEINSCVTLMNEMAAGLKQVRDALAKLPEKDRDEFESAMGELKSLANRMTARVDEFRNFYTLSENRCRWIEARMTRSSNDAIVRLHSLPLQVQQDLHDTIYVHTPTIVMTSATLSVDKKFSFFLSQTGLDGNHGSKDVFNRVETLHLETPFDYERQAFVGIPLDLPEPREPGFNNAAMELLEQALQITKGGAFLLFTSYSQLETFYRKMSPLLQTLGFTCMKQGVENRQELLQRFKNDMHSVLFATSSFWEGVDVPGHALRLLALVKLPFRVPTDPLVQARVERLEALGQDSFSEYSVPQAVIKFKQGFGRLIRTKDDYGAVLILDRRVSTKSYGQVFLHSLPSATAHAKPTKDLLNDLDGFFKEFGKPKETKEKK
ncbi:TPA: helicase [Candidatus Sumerlaeota bacterium]|nr:helicase [Candidatus Sumerlaeota bacterium]